MNVETAPDDPKKIKTKNFSAQKTKKQIEEKRFIEQMDSKVNLLTGQRQVSTNVWPQW